MEKNESKADRIIRAVIGVVFLYLGYKISAWFYIVAVIAILTAITGFCGLYKALGITTLKKKPKKKK